MANRTVKDVLIDINGILSKIPITVDQVEHIGAPIAKACNGLELCITVLENAEKEAAKEAIKSDENNSDPESVPEVIEIEPEEVENNG